MKNNKFKDLYTHDMDSLAPSDETRKAIVDAASTTTDRPDTSPRVMVRRRPAARLLAATLSVVILLSAAIAVSVSLFRQPHPFGGDYILTEEGNNNESPLLRVEDYKDIYEALAAYNSKYTSGNVDLGFDEERAEMDGDIRPSAPQDDANTDNIVAEDDKDIAGDKNDDFSDTNNQVSGVQEADIIKTDGKYIYTTYNRHEDFYYYGMWGEIEWDSDMLDDGVVHDDTSRSEAWLYEEDQAAGYEGDAPDVNPPKPEPKKIEALYCVYIVEADKGKLNLVSQIKLREDKDINYAIAEILIKKDTLIIIKQGYVSRAKTNADLKHYTALEIYDIADRANPKFVNEVYQSGYYNTSRMVGDYVYLISTYNTYNKLDKEHPENYIPVVSGYESNDLISARDIMIPEGVRGTEFAVFSGLDINNPGEFVSTGALVGWASNVYSSGDSFYFAMQKYSDFFESFDEYEVGEKIEYNTKTAIYRFAVDKGNIEYKASVTVDGNLLNQFAMDEYNGHFRVATTVAVDKYEVREYAEYIWDYSGDGSGAFTEEDLEKYWYYTYGNNSVPYPDGSGSYRIRTYKRVAYMGGESFSNVYVFDLGLNKKGFLTGLGKTEMIYSVRFDGDVGYVVTFRRTDPLYAIDLSDPTTPRVMTELKIPGFSNYMHPYGKGLLFGLGMDADNQGITSGLKISMFDVSDKFNVTEKSVYKLSGNFSHSDAQYNHKAILVDHNKNLIGFPVMRYTKDWQAQNEYHFYSYVDGEFVQRAVLDIEFADYSALRGIYIGDYAYIISPQKGIISYDLTKFEQIDKLLFVD